MEIITNQMFENQFLTGVEQNLQSELTDTEEISSGYKVNQPSDDPAALVQIVGYKTQLSSITGYQNAITIAKAPLQSLDTSLSTLNNTLERANELAITSGGGTTDTQSMQAVADEVQQLAGTAINIANTNVSGQYIFAGYNSNVNPIDPNTGELLSYNNSMSQNIGVGVNVTTNVSAGSLFSFARINGDADSTKNILPAWNWTNSGANTIPDADPVSALETSAPATYVIDPNDAISIDGQSVTLNSGASPVAYDANGFAAKLQAAIQAEGATVGGALGAKLQAVTVSYNSAGNKFTITGAAVGDVVNWSGGATTSNIEQELGFVSAVDQSIHPGITSDYKAGAFNSSDNIFTANGGALNIAVGASSTSSSGAFVINSSNNAVSLNGTTYYIANGVYTGAGLADALENNLSLNASGSPAIAAPIIDVSYDASGHKFSISDAGVGDSIDLTAAGTSTIGSIMGFNAASAPESLSTAITSDNAVGDVNLAAGSTLQNVRDAINTAAAGVKAQVVNTGTTATPDFRLVIGSDPAGNSSQIDMSPLSAALTTTGISDPSNTGVNMLSYNDAGTNDNMTLATNITNYNYIETQASGNNSIVIDDGRNGNIANNQIVVTVGGTQETATIARGTYTHDQLATAVAAALNNAANAAGVAGTPYTVSYDTNAEKFTITNTGNTPLDLLWSNSASTAQTLLGYNAVDTTIAANLPGSTSDTSNNSVVANYYSFNNNYLNDNYVLRALNFEQQSLQNGDSGRVQQAIQYTSDLSAAVSQSQSQVGATENKVSTESAQQTSSQTDIEGFLANTQDTDLASVASDLSLKQTALQALRTITTDVLSESLFDFIKPA